MIAAFLTVGPLQFERPWLLLLAALLIPWIAFASRRSLAGLGTTTRVAAVTVRTLVVLLLVGALAEPQWRRESKDVAVTVVIDASRSVPPEAQRNVAAYVEGARQGHSRPDDRLGVLTVARDAFVQSLPSRFVRDVERQHTGVLEGSDLASGLSLAMAVAPQDAANRIVLVSDGVETSGSLLEAAQAAVAAGIPIDVLPIPYHYDEEVVVDRLLSPTSARVGETIGLRVIIRATQATRGRLSVSVNGDVLDLDPDGPGTAMAVELTEGMNAIPVQVAVREPGAQQFSAAFEPDAADQVAENNSAVSITFAAGEGRLLVIADDPIEAGPFLTALAEAEMGAEIRAAESVPGDLPSLADYDAIVMMNQPAGRFTQAQQEVMRQYVEDLGGGLIVIGGPDSFGAGGWIGSPLEDALPIRLDPPSKRQMPRGALAMVMHSVEIPDGQFYGRKVCEAAVNSLSRLDLAGIVEFDPSDGDCSWTHPLSPVGDGTGMKRSILNMSFGDMPDFAPSLEVTLAGMLAAEAGQRHVIIISDGDPAPPNRSLLQRFIDAKITISTIGIGCHGISDQSTLRYIAQYTGGRFYDIPQNQVAKLPQIFIKEAQTVKRSLIWEGDPFVPAMASGGAETLRGIDGVPAIRGYVVAADREGLAMVTLRGRENDPILAQWQFGLGRSVAFTSDASSRWASDWLAWPGFRAFWEQHVRWAMRPSGDKGVRVSTEERDGRTILVVDAVSRDGQRINFADFQGRVALPDGTGIPIDVRQVGPGRYEGSFPSELPGAYVASLEYRAPAEDGREMRGTARAAVIRPFADEFRALRDNAPLMRQLAARTGGRELTGDPAKDKLWDPAGLKMPVATRPLWLAATILGIGMFVIDVGVRRVRIDLAAIGGAIRRALGSRRAQAGKQIDALRAARAQAQRKMQERAGATAEVSAPPPPVIDVPRPGSPAPTVLSETTDDAVTPPAAPAPGSDADGGMSRLLRAKKRAQNETRDQ